MVHGDRSSECMNIRFLKDMLDSSSKETYSLPWTLIDLPFSLGVIENKNEQTRTLEKI